MCWEYLKSVDVSGTVTAIAAVMTAGAAFWGVLIAKRGLHTWREQLFGTAKHKIAVDMYKSALRFQLAIRQGRCPAPEGSFQDKFDDAYWKVVQEGRVKPVEDAFQTLVDKALDLKVNLGWDLDETLKPFNKLRTEWICAIETVFRFNQRSSDPGEKRVCPKNAEAIWRKSLDPDAPDEFGSRVNVAVDQLAEQLKHY